MKTNTHPTYGPLVIRDKSARHSFLTASTLRPEATIEWEDGRTYPLLDVEVSSASHPFYTGGRKLGEARGQVAKFYQRYGK